MEGARRVVLRGTYVREPQRSRTDIEEEMQVAAMGTHEELRWEPGSSSQPAFMVPEATDAAMWEKLKNIRPPMCDGNLLNLDRFLKKLNN